MGWVNSSTRSAFIWDVHTFFARWAHAGGVHAPPDFLDQGPNCKVDVWKRVINKTGLCFSVRGIRGGLQGVGKDKHPAPFIWGVHTIFARWAHAGGIHGWTIF